MLKKTVIKITNSKIFYVIISIIISILLWLYVVNVENVEIKQTITGIPVEFIGANDILADRQLLVSRGSEQAVNLTVMGKRNIVTKLSKANIKVTVDLTDIRNVGSYQRVYNVVLPDGVIDKDVYILGKSPQYITVDIDNRINKAITIKGSLEGSVSDGYMADTMEFDPETINVSGPEEIVSQISYAEIIIKREKLKETVVEQSKYVLKDDKGNTIQSDEIKTDIDTVEAKLPILMIKEVALTVDIVPGGGATKENAKVVINPLTVKLSGDPDLLEGINQLSLGTINLAEINSVYKETLAIPIPNEVKNISGNKSAEVSIEIIGLSTKKLIGTNFEIINVTPGYSATVVEQTMDITIRGPADEVALVGTHNIRIVCDLSEIGQFEGITSVEPTIYVDGYQNVGVISDYSKVVISQSEKDGGP